MAPAPGSGHPEDDSLPPSAAAAIMTTSTQEQHQNGASPTPAPSTYPPMPSSWYGSNWPGSLTPVPLTTDAYGMILVILVDGEGHSVWQYSTQGNQQNGAHASTTPYQDQTSSSYYKTSSPTPLSTGSTSSQLPIPIAAQPENGEHHGRPPIPALVAMGIIIPSLLILLCACAFLYCVRQRKRKTVAPGEEIAAARMVPEMKDTGVGGGPNMLSTRAVGPISASGAVASPLPSPTSTTSTATGTPPVILSTTMNDAYYTGIDTSDHISLTDQRSEASADTFGEEPPPPYRPRSVPPISRETSMRNSMCRNTSVRSNRNDPMSGSNLMGTHVRRSVDVRSPFDDPEDSDDDNISQISTIRSLPRRDTDRLSVVSDMSYQEEPTNTHSAV